MNLSNSKSRLRELMKADKYIIAGVHFLPLPGSPGYDREEGIAAIIERAKSDTQILVENGVHGILFANEADVPYQQVLSPETIASFTAVVNEVCSSITVPCGVNVLVDPVAGVSIAHATGCAFLRGYFAGGYVTDMGIMDTRGPEALRLRANLNARNIHLLHNLSCAFGVPLVKRPIAEEAYGIKVHTGVDGFTISGRAAGFSPEVNSFREVAEKVPEMPLVVGTGANINNIESLLEVADGAIVVTSLRQDGKTLNPVDPQRVKDFMHRVRQITEQ